MSGKMKERVAIGPLEVCDSKFMKRHVGVRMSVPFLDADQNEVVDIGYEIPTVKTSSLKISCDSDDAERRFRAAIEMCIEKCAAIRDEMDGHIERLKREISYEEIDFSDMDFSDDCTAGAGEVASLEG